MDTYLAEFLIREVATHDKKDVARWQQRLAQLISFMLRAGMPMEKLSLSSYREMDQQARNAELALLIALSATARHTREISRVSWPNATSAGTWLYRLQGQREGRENNALNYLCFMDMAGEYFYVHDLFGSNLEGADLSGTRLQYSNLSEVNLLGADLSESNLSGAIVEGANFRNAILTGTILEGKVKV